MYWMQGEDDLHVPEEFNKDELGWFQSIPIRQQRNSSGLAGLSIL